MSRNLIFDKKISLINFKNKDFDNLKNLILNVVSNCPEISSKDLQKKMIDKGFTVQINNFMQSNYPTRLNFNLDHLNEENICSTFSELLSLLDFKNI